MSNKYFVVAWAALAILCLIESVNGLSKTLGWGLVIDSPFEFGDPKRSTTAWAPVYFIVWFALQLPLIAITHEVLMRNTQREPWTRLPSLAGMPDATENGFTRVIHKLTLSLLLAVIVYAGVHFFWQTLEAVVYCGGELVVSTEGDHFGFKTHPEACYLDGKEAGVQYYPLWESWAFLGCLSSVLALWIWFVWRLVRTEAPGESRVSNESKPSR
jgi:hypothetical protein